MDVAVLKGIFTVSCSQGEIFIRRMISQLDFQRMASVNQKRFEDENLVIISSNTAIDMTQWRKYLIENWDKVFFLSNS